MLSATPRLATRCSSCGTSFRVSEEQLQVSDGHVRCGRCDAVFNARGSLFDLDAPASAPAPLTPNVTAASIAAAHSPARSAEARPEAPAGAERNAAAPAEPQWEEGPETVAEDSREPVWESTLTHAPSADEAEEANARLRDLLGVSPAAEPSTVGVAAEQSPLPPSPAQWSSLETPIRRAGPTRRGNAGWRALLAATAAGLALAIPMQWAWIEREPLRARFAPVDAWLQQYLPGLQASGWRHLEGLSVASSALQMTPQGRAYRLELVVSNRAGHRLAMPSLDLSLNDAKGQVLLRRTLSPEQLGAAAKRPLEAGEQRKLQAVFQVQGAEVRVSGYELGLFHP
jgi:predicted Zn finger-like uncharacterized protein